MDKISHKGNVDTQYLGSTTVPTKQKKISLGKVVQGNVVNILKRFHELELRDCDDKKSYSKIFRNGKVEAVRALTLVLAFRYKKIFVPISLPPTV